MEIAEIDQVRFRTGFCCTVEQELYESSRGTHDGPGASVDGDYFHGGVCSCSGDGSAEDIMR
jgi:hypothetical protein